MKIETRIVKKGETFVLKGGYSITPNSDLYFVIVNYHWAKDQWLVIEK